MKLNNNNKKCLNELSKLNTSELKELNFTGVREKSIMFNFDFGLVSEVQL